MRLIVIGQPMYFRIHYADMLNPALFAGETLEIPYIHNLTPPESLAGLEADVIFCFRGELVPAEIVATWKGLKVHLSTEPMPRLVENDQVEISNDRGQRMWEMTNGKAAFDRRYHFDRTSRAYLEKYGIPVDGEFILPVSRIPDQDRPAEMTWDVFFYGRETSHRAQMTSTLKHFMGERYLQIAHGIYGDELLRLAGQSAIGLNLHVDHLTTHEPRLQQMMAMGLCVFSEPLSHNDLYKPGVHYVEVVSDQDLWGKAVYYLDHPGEMARIAQAGRTLVRSKLDAVTEWTRLAKMLLEGKTYMPNTERKRH